MEDFKPTFIKYERENTADLVKGDVVYIQKMVGGYTENYEVSFIGVERGILSGKILRQNWNGNKWNESTGGEVITGRVTKCYIRDEQGVCHWLTNSTEKVRDGVVRIQSVEQLQKVAKKLGVRHDWHEPDEQGLTAIVTGESFDNAGGHIEKIVRIFKDEKQVATINLATLLAFATGTYKGF